jgi:hypothetical protein
VVYRVDVVGSILRIGLRLTNHVSRNAEYLRS